jgi:hypothetical protein
VTGEKLEVVRYIKVKFTIEEAMKAHSGIEV